MRRLNRLGIIGLVLLLCAPGIAVFAQTPDDAGYAVVLEAVAPVFDAPSLSSGIHGSLAAGALLRVISDTSSEGIDWCQVEAGDIAGYVPAGQLRRLSDTESALLQSPSHGLKAAQDDAQAAPEAIATPQELATGWVEASSERASLADTGRPGAFAVFPAENVLDGKPETCWIPALQRDALGNGVGEYIDIGLAQPATVSGLSVLNGYCVDEATFYANSRPNKLSISFRIAGETQFGSDRTVRLEDGFKGMQIFAFDDHPGVDAVRIQILDAYGGTRNNADICIAELRVLGQ